jgi:hypothetical protein
LAGVDRVADVKLVYEYLREPLYGLVTNTSSALFRSMTLASILAAKPVAETTFRGAIEAGDDRTVHTLLSVEELGLDVNNPTCTAAGGQCTPVEKSAELYHLSVVELLIAFGANVNRVKQRALDTDQWKRRTDLPQGALEYALSGRKYQDCTVVGSRTWPCVPLRLIELLLKAGGDFAGDFLLEALAFGREDAGVVQMLITERLVTSYESWLELVIFHMAVKHLDSEANALIFHKLWEVKGNLDYEKTKCLDPYYDISPHPLRPPPPRPRLPPRLIDIAAERGDLYLVQLLHGYGAKFTNHTLTVAIRSGNRYLTHALLEWEAPVDTFSRHFKSTPYAEAIRVRDSATIRTLVDLGCEANLKDAYRLCATLAALAEVGDRHTLQDMLSNHFSRKLHPAWVLGYALAKAVRSNHTTLAVDLLEAGASPLSRNIIAAFGQYDGSLRAENDLRDDPE